MDLNQSAIRNSTATVAKNRTDNVISMSVSFFTVWRLPNVRHHRLRASDVRDEI